MGHQGFQGGKQGACVRGFEDFEGSGLRVLNCCWFKFSPLDSVFGGLLFIRSHSSFVCYGENLAGVEVGDFK